jgi:hypothetical protein
MRVDCSAVSTLLVILAGLLHASCEEAQCQRQRTRQQRVCYVCTTSCAATCQVQLALAAFAHCQSVSANPSLHTLHYAVHNIAQQWAHKAGMPWKAEWSCDAFTVERASAQNSWRSRNCMRVFAWAHENECPCTCTAGAVSALELALAAAVADDDDDAQ